MVEQPALPLQTSYHFAACHILELYTQCVEMQDEKADVQGLPPFRLLPQLREMWNILGSLRLGVPETAGRTNCRFSPHDLREATLNLHRYAVKSGIKAILCHVVEGR
jgi:hypothetical protein